MKGPLKASPPEPLATVEPARHVDELGGAFDGLHAADARRSRWLPWNHAVPAKSGTRAFAPGEANIDLRSVRPEVTVRVSVIDGADRLVHVNVQDRKGWTQLLAAQQVANELRGRLDSSSATHGGSLSGARTVRALETARTADSPRRADSVPGPRTPTPYSLGKASVLAGASLSAQQRRMSAASKSSTLPVQATAQAPTRAR